MDYRKSNRLMPKQLMAGGTVLLAIGLLVDLQRLPFFMSKKNSEEVCQQIGRSQAKLSRSQLAKFLVVPEGDQKQKVRDILKEPYCNLAGLQIRAGATAQREAYLLDFDPQTWLVVLYEGDQYAGYRFSIH